MLHAKTLHKINMDNKSEIINDIQLAEFKVFSQWGDDGIIQFLIDYLDIKENTFIEFGVEDYTESNTRFLLLHNNWKGLVMDGSKRNIDYIRNDNIYWRYDITAKQVFITTKNINKEIEEAGFKNEIGLLHVDIDGNDYWVWNEISVVNPIIVIVEYNSVFGSERAISVPYDPSFVRSEIHHSNLFFGASIKAFVHLAKIKGYSFIGCNSNGNNAYFVRNDKIKDLKVYDSEKGYVESKFRESRDRNGKLSFVSGKQRIHLIAGLPVINILTGEQEIL